MGAVIHDVEAQVEVVELVGERHPASKKVNVKQSEVLHFVP